MGKLISSATDAVGLTDYKGAEKAAKQGQALTKEQMARIQAIDLPDIEKMKVALEAPELVGLLEAQEMGPSEMEDISIDPRLREAQMLALQELQERGETGFTAEDRAQLGEMRRAEDARAQAAQQGILAEAAARGTMDSGMALAAKLAAQQGSAQRAMQGAEQMAAQGAAARRQALMQAGQMGGQMAQQQFGQQAQQAQAADAINRFNVQNRQQVASQNLASRQRIADEKARLANQQQMYNKGLLQQQFQNEMSKAGATGQAAGNLAAQYGQQAQAKASQGTALMSGLATVGAGLASGGFFNGE